MPLTVDQLTAEALQLSVSLRAELAEKLVESLDLSADSEIQRAWSTEALHRREEVRSGKVQTIPGEQVLAEVRRALGQ
jgi:putative addiction module component (TIGR02574 family)